MKKFFVLIVLIVAMTVNAQEKSSETIEDKSEKKETKTEAKNLPNGYGNLEWGVLLSAARTNIEGKMVYTDDKTIIISKDGELRYYYGFFYKDPTKLKTKSDVADVESLTTETGIEENKKENDEGKLFYVALKFPYLMLNDVFKKMVDKYGKPTSDNLIDNRGAIGWDSERTIIVMWVDNYEKKPFCRRITYIDKNAIKNINKYHFEMFNKTEIELIKKLKP